MPLTPYPEKKLLCQDDYLIFENVMQEDELLLLEEYFNSTDPQAVRKDGIESSDGIKDAKIRSSNLSFYNYDDTNELSIAAFQSLYSLTESINDAYFGFNLTGFSFLQLTSYYKGQHYSLHCDKFSDLTTNLEMNSAMHRKLSFSLILSEPEEYEGGKFQVMDSGVLTTLEQKRNTLIAFPSWTLHRVGRVKTGLRKSIVWWVYGPKFV